MLAASTPAEPEPAPEPEPEPNGGKLSQEQIESMLAASAPAEPEPAPEPEPEPTGGKLSQEQIEAMLALDDLDSGSEAEKEPEPQKPAAKKEEAKAEDYPPEDPESARFNSMLSAAKKKVVANDNSLSQDQIEAMLSVNEPDDESEEQQKVPDSNKGKSVEELLGMEPGEADNDEDSQIADKFREGITADSQAAADDVEQRNKKKKEKKPKKEKKTLDKATLTRIIMVAAVVVAAALGFCVSLLLFSDLIKTGAEEFSIKAANAVNSKLPINTEMYVYKAYVRSGKSADECMLYAMTSRGGKDNTDIYHVVIYHDNPGRINVYYTLDTENPEYLRMKESDNEKERVQASLLKKYSDEIEAADREIQINSPEWEKIDCTKINRNITSEQVNSK